jgi:hypothetical protein
VNPIDIYIYKGHGEKAGTQEVKKTREQKKKKKKRIELLKSLPAEAT